jgi:hypothetical protein
MLALLIVLGLSPAVLAEEAPGVVPSVIATGGEVNEESDVPANLEPISSVDKAAQLQVLRARSAAEVSQNGFQSDLAKDLFQQIRRLERRPVLNATALGGGPESRSMAASPTTAAPLFNKNEHMVPGIEKVPDYEQTGAGNPCGAYAVASVLRSFGKANSYRNIYDEIVPVTMGTSPNDIRSYLMDNDCSVNDRNHGSLDDLAGGVDREERMILLLNTRGSGFGNVKGLHWAAVKGYRIKNGQRYWVLEDTFYGADRELSDEELSKAWDEPVIGSSFGFDHYYMTVGNEPPNLIDRAKNALYGMNDRTAAEVTTSGMRDVQRGWQGLTGKGRGAKERVSGFFHMIGGGVMKLVAGGVIGGLSVGAHYVEQRGSALMAWGQDKWKNGGFFGKAVGVGATLLGAVTAGTGWVLGTALNLATGICGALGDLVGTVGDAIGGVCDWVGSLFD